MVPGLVERSAHLVAGFVHVLVESAVGLLSRNLSVFQSSFGIVLRLVGSLTRLLARTVVLSVGTGGEGKDQGKSGGELHAICGARRMPYSETAREKPVRP